jgi:hypothetical protein
LLRPTSIASCGAITRQTWHATIQDMIRKMFRIDKLPAEERARIIEKDKSQYLQWFHRK